LATVIMLPLSWNRLYQSTIAWGHYQSAGYTQLRSVNFSSNHGGVHFTGQELTNVASPGPRALLPLTVGVGIGRGDERTYPLWNDRFSVTRSDFIQKTLGFQICWASSSPTGGGTETTGMYAITVPHWFVLLLCLPFPLLWFRRFWRRRYRVQHGLCLSCGYDLRGSAGKCPECGAEIGRAEGAGNAGAVGGGGERVGK
jgi:hypothetical protein